MSKETTNITKPRPPAKKKLSRQLRVFLVEFGLRVPVCAFDETEAGDILIGNLADAVGLDYIMSDCIADIIEVKVGDTVKLKIFNEDSYDHGFALDVFAVNEQLFPERETEIQFVASKVGAYSFYCSVPCGEGHYHMIGTFIVKE